MCVLMQKQGAGQSGTLWSLYCILSLLSLFSMQTTCLLLGCLFLPVGGLRSGKCLLENFIVASKGNSFAGLTYMAQGKMLLSTSEITFE
jgi:hypothetical protein